jgi:hypothetical protein
VLDLGQPEGRRRRPTLTAALYFGPGAASGHRVLAQNNRRLARAAGPVPDAGLFERDLEEEPQRGAGLVDGRPG